MIDIKHVRWQLGIATTLLALLGVLATLQYRWLGDVAEAERERIRTALRSRATEFAQDFDSELTKVYVAFHVDGERLDVDAAATIDDAMTRWRSSAESAGIVQGVYLGEQKDNVVSWRRFHAHVLEPSDWPPRLDTWRRASEHLSRIVGAPAPLIPGDVLDAQAPAIIIGIPKLERMESGADVAYVPDLSGGHRFLAIELDSDFIQRQLLEPLVAKYFGSAAGGDYVVTIVRRDDPAVAVYTTQGDPIVDETTADVTSPLFDLRLDEVRRLMMMRPPPGIGGGSPLQISSSPREGFAIATFVRRTAGREGRGMMLAGGPGEGAWQIRVRHRSGSLESIVARSRRRNLAISLGILGLLAAAVALVILSAQRQRRLAHQQMEFVAAVSHELRTPLAVICSAGENLADGVVVDRSQVKRYGALVESEGRRLTDMVDRVMEFAGIGTGAPLYSRTDVNISAVVAEVVNGISAEARDRGVSVSLRSDVKSSETAPVVAGDPDALRSAVQNIVGNAVKYSPGGGHVDVGVETAGPLMTIRVSDRGLGIDSADLPHVFEPFYRGRRALDAQIRGTGVGLSIVRRVIDAHEGAIRIDSRAGEGTTVTVELPLTLARTA